MFFHPERSEGSLGLIKLTVYRFSVQRERLFATLRVTEVSAAGGRYSEPEEGKVTSNQEGIYAVAGCDDNFSGDGKVVMANVSF